MESNKAKVYCIAIDGSKCSDWAFELVFNELYQKGDKIIVVHISNNEKEVPFAFQSKTIMSKYDAILTGKLQPQDYSLIFKEREKKSEHALAQVNTIATENKASILILGFMGHKMKTGEISKGITYVINNVKIPTIVVKENSQRKNKEDKSFTWCSFIEQPNTRSFKAFQFAMNYVSPKDHIVTAHIKVNGDMYIKEIKEISEKALKDKGITNYKFDSINSKSNELVTTQICNYVNYNETDTIDFLVLGHNPTKIVEDKNHVKACVVSAAIQSAQSNILFYY